MVYHRFIEIGRVVLISSGKDAGKLAVIVDVIDQARLLVDGVSTGVARQAIGFRSVSLTDFKIKVAPSAGSGHVAKAFKEAGIAEKWAATSWARKLASRKTRANLSDFDRFVVKINRQKRARIQNKELSKLKKTPVAAKPKKAPAAKAAAKK
eukprot:m.67025 g.67025  ORF g.67025 m.67025 type:complete len:152 (+) comp14088_c2_seq1:59-514(+)